MANVVSVGFLYSLTLNIFYKLFLTLSSQYKETRGGWVFYQVSSDKNFPVIFVII